MADKRGFQIASATKGARNDEEEKSHYQDIHLLEVHLENTKIFSYPPHI
jgi:hypothetical protein